MKSKKTNESGKIRVLIADDHAIVRTGLTSLLGTQKDFIVVGEADDGESVVDKAIRLNPDVIIMDYRMPQLDGAAATKKILSRHPDIKILILTSYSEAEGIARALRSGAAGAMMKTDDNDTLIAAIRDVADGNKHVSQEIERMLKESPQSEELTERQLQILDLVVRGLSNRDIAELLGIREDSVKKHANAIYAKIGASNRVEATAIAIRRQLLNWTD